MFHITPTPHPRLRLPDGVRIYAIGDIHGSPDLLAQLYKGIRDDLETTAVDRAVLVHLGDYVDRGPRSPDVIEMLIDPPLTGPEYVFLKGNHEDFMLRFLDDGGPCAHWLLNGGDTTLTSYGIDPWAFDGGYDADALHRALHDGVPKAHVDFLRALKLSYQVGNAFFAHAGIRPGVALAKQTPHDLIWIREPFLDSNEDFGAVVIHGHSPRTRQEVRDNRINVDTGAFASGHLTAARLQGDTVGFLQT